MKLLERAFIEQLHIEIDVNGNAIVGGISFSPLEILSRNSLEYNEAFENWKIERLKPRQKKNLEKILSIDGNKKRFEDLCEEINKDNVVPFVGSGLSVPSGLPTWTDFLRKIRKKSKLSSKKLEELLSNFKFEEAVDLLLAKNTTALFDEAIEHELRVESTKNIVGAVLLLPEIFQKLVLTTNLDNILEDVYFESNNKFTHVLSGTEIENYPRLRSAKDVFLLKIHGDRRVHKSRVLSKKEYETAYRIDSPIREEFDLIARTKSLLFLGCSLGADRTVSLIGETYRQYSRMLNHYAFLQIPPKPERIDREHFLTERKILPVWYEHDHDESIQTLLMGVLESQGRL